MSGVAADSLRREVIHGDCLEVMPTLGENSVDAIVTDPPYGLAFMGKGWDHAVPGEDYWRAALRVAKPGAHLLAFGGTRTFHRLACAIEDAGWELRDTVMWVYGSGFPKSLDVSKAIDKAAGAERAVVGDKLDLPGYHLSPGGGNKFGNGNGLHGHREDARLRSALITAPATDAARQWRGWGTALKPAWEPVIVARKPLAGTVAANVLEWGTGGINVDGCRVEGAPPSVPQPSFNSPTGRTYGTKTGEGRNGEMSYAPGRWPANVIHEGSDEATAGMGESARFFYCAKASRADRGEGNTHPTVKPTALMRYLCRLVTPPGGTVLDPFTGSGSTGKAATLEGFNFVGIELESDYCDIARRRIAHAECGVKA